MRQLVYSDTEYSTNHKATSQKCLKRLFKWRRHELGEEVEWEPTHSFSPDASQPRDYLTVEERKLVREAALEYGSVPLYSNLDHRRGSHGNSTWRSDLRSPSTT